MDFGYDVIELLVEYDYDEFKMVCGVEKFFILMGFVLLLDIFYECLLFIKL